MSSDRLRAAADRLDTAEWLPASVDYATAALLRAVAADREWQQGRVPDPHGVYAAALALASVVLGDVRPEPTEPDRTTGGES